LLLSKEPNLIIASPKWRGNKQPHTKLDAVGYRKQVTWESEFLDRAARLGCIMFWLACETEHDPERSYAQTTRFELAEWVTRSFYWNPHPKIVIGIEPGFPGERYIRERCCEKRSLGNLGIFKIEDTLESTCKAVIAAVHRG